jgi:hypothetical protein
MRQGTCEPIEGGTETTCQVEPASCTPGKELYAPNTVDPKLSIDTCQPLNTLSGCRCKSLWSPFKASTLTGACTGVAAERCCLHVLVHDW